MKRFPWIGAALLFFLTACAPPATPAPTTTAGPTPGSATPVPSPTPRPTATPQPTLAAYPLSGAPADAYLDWPPLAVMVPSDSGQYGLSQASLVYVAVAEGQVPRYLAVFERLEAAKVGPIRSARPYFVDWACPYGPLFVCWGGSPRALEMLGTSECVRSLDGQTYGRGYFFHQEDPWVPWNSEFTSSELLYGYLRNWEIARETHFQGYTHKDDAPLSDRPLTATVSFSYDLPVRYLYDPAGNVYRREYGGRPHLDLLTGLQVEVKNLALLFVPRQPIPGDDQGRLEFQTAGEGEAWILRDGLVVRGRWRKESAAAELRLLDGLGREVALNCGNLWIEVLAPGQEVVVAGGR